MKKMIDFMEIVKSLGDSGLLIKSVSNTNKKVDFLACCWVH